MDKDLECYQRYLSGDDGGIEELLERYGAKLISFIYRFVGDMELAEELMEDTFCDIIIKGGFSGSSSFKTYLYAIAKNKAYSELKRRKRFAYVDDISFIEAAGSSSDIENKERADAILLALSKLKRDHRTVLYLLYYEDMSYKDAAKVMKKTEGQIKSLAFRAKKSMRSVLEKEGLTYEELI
ncbi:MAG: RNA polymerase sigma factor [Ruminococcaceae bacterium]|nr:RNA polymerase sigma factor [Oscillospiraceae bacterium]